MEGLDLAWPTECGQLGAGIFLASQLIDFSLESGGSKTALVSFTGFGHATWEANLVDLSDLDRFGTIPLMLEVGDD